MPRLEADYRISLKVYKTGITHKIELINMPNCKRYFVRYNGKNSTKFPTGTKSEIINEIRKFLKD